MFRQIPKSLFDKGLITSEQFEKIDLITSGRIISVFYELRSLLYLGVLLFTAGAGILIYENIGDIGHIISVTILMLLAMGCFYYVFKFGHSYHHEELKAPTPYFDYIVLLGALLFISVLGYLEFLYGIFEAKPGLITLTTSVFFFYVAYRFDSKAVLSLAITALASYFSITVSPQKWYSGDFELSNLYITAIVFSVAMGGASLFLDRSGVKAHFTFTYLNFCVLIFFAGAITGVFEDEWYGLYLLLVYAGCFFAYFIARWKRSFLFMLYAFLAAYVGTTYVLAETIMDEPSMWFWYSLLSCGGFIYFIIRFKSYFKQQP